MTRLPLSLDVSAILICYAFIIAYPQASASEPVTINPGSETYDYHPSAARTADGTTWVTWHGYSNGRDQIFARNIAADGSLGELHVVSEGGDTHGPPKLHVGADGAVAIVWAAKINDRWQIVFRAFRDGKLSWLAPVSDDAYDAIYPAIIHRADGGLYVAWSEHRDGKFQIRGHGFEGGLSTKHFGISTASVDAFRPVLVSHSDSVWAFWDQYEAGAHSVHGRQVFPVLLPEEQISPEGDNCLTPTAMSHSGGIYVAWLRKVDVMGGPGVVSQWHTFHAAVRRNNDWNLITTPDGKTTAAELTQGLMARIDPKPVATGGYLGPRLHPMWMKNGDRAWLLWERKSNHRGSTPTVSGHLIGRTVQAGMWQSPVVLQQERIAYEVVHPAETIGGQLQVLSSAMPHRGLRTYASMNVDLESATAFEQDEWPGWTPVELPIASEVPPRREMVVDGKRFKLFWADMHCHNGLTADAEGQPYEMQFYARDRAKLDVVVFTNNDFYQIPLTQYDFQLGNLFARTFSKGEFLSLPGFEWTSRIPGLATASLSDPGNWLPPYKNKSYPNHRSVIYPPSGGPLVHFPEVGNDIAKLNEAVQTAGGITLSQHAAFKLSGHAVEVGMELTSGWSNYIASRPKLFHEPLNKGARLGFTANGDTHRRAPGLSGALTGIYAEELTAEAILEALRQRRCFATMGARIFVDSRADGTPMGQEVKVDAGGVALSVKAIGTRPIVSATLIRDGKEVYRAEGSDGSLELNADFSDDKLSAGTHWYYWRIRQERDAPVLPGNLMPAHGHLAWSSPHWVVVD